MATEFCAEWLLADGRIVRFEGLTWKIRVNSYRQKYPFARDVTDVSLDPTMTTKMSAQYRRVRAELGDDYSVAVLALSPEDQTALLVQVEGN